MRIISQESWSGILSALVCQYTGIGIDNRAHRIHLLIFTQGLFLSALLRNNDN